MQMQPRRIGDAVIVATLIVAACGGEAKNTCVTGSSVECACPGGVKGVQRCQADGTFSACACDKPNTAPTAPVASMPSSVVDDADVVCSITTPSTDADGDAVTYAFTWTRNGQAFAGAVTVTTTSTVPSTATSAGDVFTCTVAASDGKTTAPGNTVAVTIAAPEPKVFASCAAVKAANAAATDGLYDIDPDGAGPVAPVKLFCDMTNGSLTLVANIYDSAGDDAPNSTDYVVSGWQQTASGQWNKAAKVEKDSSGTGSAAVSLAFVAALKASAGQQNLRMCFVHQNGADTTCRNSADGSMTLVSYPTGNPKLTAYSGNTLPYTYGRLAGLAGTSDGYSEASFTNAGACIPRATGMWAEFGDQTAGLCECTDWWLPAVWHGWGSGQGYRPVEQSNFEIASAPVELGSRTRVADANVETYGFRLYVGP